MENYDKNSMSILMTKLSTYINFHFSLLSLLLYFEVMQ